MVHFRHFYVRKDLIGKEIAANRKIDIKNIENRLSVVKNEGEAFTSLLLRCHSGLRRHLAVFPLSFLLGAQPLKPRTQSEYRHKKT